MNAVKPVLDALGKRAAEFANSFTDDPERWDRIVNAATRLGEVLSSIVEDVFNLLPDTNTLAENIIAGVEGITDWIAANKENIIAFFIGIGDTIRNRIIPFFTEQVLPIFNKWSQWFEDNKIVILLFFQAIRDIFSEFISDLMGGPRP